METLYKEERRQNKLINEKIQSLKEAQSRDMNSIKNK